MRLRLRTQSEDSVASLRIKVLLAIFLLASVLLLYRLFSWQVLDSQRLLALAQAQHQITKTISAHRGSIFTSDDFPLAASRQSWLVWASIPQVKDPQGIAEALAPLVAPDPVNLELESLVPEASSSAKAKEELVKIEKERIKGLLRRPDVVWVPLKHKVSGEVKEKIESLKLAGIGFDPEEDRSYPEASLAAHLLGFVGKDSAGENQGYGGLEGFYNLELSGSRGERAWEKDASGRPILLGLTAEIAAEEGLNLRTHINRSLQFILEKHLKNGLAKYQAKEVSAIIMRPGDGAILASASLPSYDPARYSLYPASRFVDPTIGESFEPGSIFKVLVMAAALDAGAVKPETRCDNCGGPVQIAEYTIGSGTNKYYPDTNMTDIIVHSDNVGMIWVAGQLGLEKLYQYLVKFGIGSASGVDLQGESFLPLRKLKDWTIVDQATAAFGQGIATTPIQMVRALSAIANGGRLPTPHVVEKIEGEGWIQEIKSQMSERVITSEAAKEITEMMTSAVDSRPDWGKPPGFRVAGKTGTAQIPLAGHYDPAKSVHSFMGFAPAEDAQFAMIVTLKDPQNGQFASQTAAPLWFDITGDIIPVLGIQPSQ